MKPVVSSIVALALAMAPLTAFAAESHAKPASAKVAKHTKKGEKIAKAEKAEKGSDKSEKSEKSEKVSDKVVEAKAEKAGISRVHHMTKDKPVHHAEGVEIGGAGHREPKMVDHGGALVPVSLTTKVHVKADKADKCDKTEKIEKVEKTEKCDCEKADKADKLEKAEKAEKSDKVEKTEKLERVSMKETRELPRLPSPRETAHENHHGADKASAGKSGAEKGARKSSEKKAEKADSSDDGQSERDEDFAELVARIRGSKHVSGTRASSDDEPSEPKARSVDESAQSKLKRVSTKTACVKEAVEFIRGPELEKFELTKCDGSIAPLAVEHLSILVRPGSAARPTAPVAELAKVKGPELAHGIRRIDERLVVRLQAIVDHFAKTTGPAKLSIVSGYRPTSIGSMHASGRAVDFRVEGVKNEDLVAFCKTLTDTGCGYYPNSSFVHVDVRDKGAGHVTWIDASGPGETPRYVSVWPPPAPKSSDIENTSIKEALTPIDRELEGEPIDEHPAAP